MKRRLTRKNKQTKKKKILILTTLCLGLCLSVGYAAFSTNLSLKAKGNIKVLTGGEMLKKECNIETGDGLYNDIYEEGKCTYKGANPNNYITFNNELWRIISVDKDNTIKIIRNETNDKFYWNEYSPNWENGDLKNHLNNEYINEITVNTDKIIDKDFKIGSALNNNDNLIEQIKEEGSKIWTGKIGLPTASEYLRANSNASQCETMKKEYTNRDICLKTNWMQSLVNENEQTWTITPYFSSSGLNSNNVYVIQAGRELVSQSCYGTIFYSPVLNLSSDIKLEGKGTIKEPFEIVG